MTHPVDAANDHRWHYVDDDDTTTSEAKYVGVGVLARTMSNYGVSLCFIPGAKLYPDPANTDLVVIGTAR